MRRWLTLALTAVCVMALVPARTAFAHATFLGSDPVDGSVLQQAPEYIELRFSERVLLDASSVTLLELGSGTSNTLPLSSTDGGTTVRAALPTLGAGAYLVDFVAIDPADLHKTVGTISFGIGTAAPPSARASTIDGSWLTVAVRTVSDAALLMAAGGAGLLVLVARRRSRLLRPVPTIVVGASAVVAVGWIGLFVLDVASVGFAHARWSSLIISSDPGRRALIGVQLAIAVWWICRLLPTANEASRWLLARILGVLALAFLALAAMGGHGGVGGGAWVGFGLRVVHLGALAAWLGLVTVTWLATRADSEWGSMWRPVSRSAAWGLALTGATGLLLSGRLVDTVTALLSTTYGRAVVAKVLLLLVLALLGWFAARRLAHGGRPGTVAVEVGVAVLAVGFAALLGSSAPAKGAQFEPLPPDVPQRVTHDVADLTVSASLEPARPGANLLSVDVLDTRRPPLGTIEGVTVTVTRADGEVVATREGVPDKGTLEWPDVELVSPGTYQVSVAVDRPAVPVPDVEDSFVVAPTPVPRADTVVSDRPWWPIALVSALSWVALVAVGRRASTRESQGSSR